MTNEILATVLFLFMEFEMVRGDDDMLVILKGTHPYEGEISQDFTYGERETAVHIGRLWAKRGWKPRLLVKSWDGHFVWLTSLLSQTKMAA